MTHLARLPNTKFNLNPFCSFGGEIYSSVKLSCYPTEPPKYSTRIERDPGRMRLKCDCTRAETRFRISAKRTSPFKSAGASVQSTTGSRGVRISVSNAGYTMFRRSVKSTGYPLHPSVSPSLPLPCVTVCHHISTGLYYHDRRKQCRNYRNN